MKNIIIIESMEANNIKNRRLNILLDYISKNKNSTIYVFTEKDKIYINENFNLKIDVINITKSNIYSDRFEIDRQAYLKTKEIIDRLKINGNKYLNIIIESLFGNIYMMIKNSNKVKCALNSIIDDQANVLLIGKKNINKSFGSLFVRQILKYDSNISYWTNIICNQNNLKIEYIDTGNVLKKFIFIYIQPIILNLGMTLIDSFYIIKNTKINNEKLVVIRRINDKKLFDDLENKKFLNENEVSYLTKKSLLKNFQEKNNLSKIMIKFSFIEMFKQIMNLKNIHTIKLQCEEIGINWFELYSSIIINSGIIKSLEKNIKKYNFSENINFEETNFYGAICCKIAKIIDIKTVTIQHGFTAAYDYTIPLLSDKRLVWGNIFKRKYIELGENKESIINIGKTIFNIYDTKKYNNLKRLKVLLAPEQIDIYDNPKEWINDVIEVISKKYKNIFEEIIISIHPKYKWFNEICSQIKHKNVKFIRGISNELEYVDMVISGNTSVGFESVLYGIRCIFYNKNSYILYEYLKHELINSASNVEELNKCISKTIYEDEVYLESVRKNFINEFL